MSKIVLRTLLASTLLSFVLTGCSEPKPYKIGFIGGLSGRVADLGTAGRNGFTLAIEEINAQGGINGRPVKAIYKDDQQDAKLAVSMLNLLINEEVDAVIGPMTSAMAVATAGTASKARLLMMSCTATTDQLSGLDDYFMRPLASANAHAAQMANFIMQQEPELTSAGAIIDIGNEAHTRNWLNGFTSVYQSKGNTLVGVETFTSSQDTDFIQLAQAVLNKQPSLVVLSMNAVDAALTIKQIKSLNPNQQIIVSEWAGTKRLIQLGGKYAEGAYVPHYINHSGTESTFLEFLSRYQLRFKSSAGFPGMSCYNATSMVLTALAQRSKGEELKTRILKIKRFDGVQEPVILDQFGDGSNTTYITRIINGEYVLME